MIQSLKLFSARINSLDASAKTLAVAATAVFLRRTKTTSIKQTTNLSRDNLDRETSFTNSTTSRSSEMAYKQPKKVALISAKMCLGQGKPGTELGPQYLKNEFLLETLELLNCSTVEHTEIDSIQVPKEIQFLNNRNIVGIAKTNQNLSSAVTSALLDGFTPVVLGGDHSLAIGSVFGTAQALSAKSQIGLIWIDAHADINTPMTSWSGNLHGQSVSFLLYELEKYHPKIEAFETWLSPCLTARNIVYIGLRDLDRDETMLVNKLKIKAFCMSDIERMGMKEVVRQAFDHLTIDGELLPLHVSVDIDSLDPWYAPSTGTPVLGGLTLPQLMYIGNCVHDSGKLATLDLVEVNPLIKTNEDDVKKTIFSATRAILSFFGYKTIGTFDPKGAIPIADRRASLVPPP